MQLHHSKPAKKIQKKHKLSKNVNVPTPVIKINQTSTNTNIIKNKNITSSYAKVSDIHGDLAHNRTLNTTNKKHHKHHKKSKKRGSVTGRVRDEIPSDFLTKTIYPPPSNMWAINKELVDTENSLHQKLIGAGEAEAVQSTHDDIILHAEEEKESEKENERIEGIPRPGVEEDLSEVLLAKGKVPKYISGKFSHHNKQDLSVESNSEPGSLLENVDMKNEIHRSKLADSTEGIHNTHKETEDAESYLTKNDDNKKGSHIKFYYKPLTIKTTLNHKLGQIKKDTTKTRENSELRTKQYRVKPNHEMASISSSDTREIADELSKKEEKESSKIVYPRPHFTEVKKKKEIELMEKLKSVKENRNLKAVQVVIPQKDETVEHGSLASTDSLPQTGSVVSGERNEVSISPTSLQDRNNLVQQSQAEPEGNKVIQESTYGTLLKPNVTSSAQEEKLVESKETADETALSEAEVMGKLMRSDGKPATEQEILNHARAIQFIREQHKKAVEEYKQKADLENKNYETVNHNSHEANKFSKEVTASPSESFQPSLNTLSSKDDSLSVSDEYNVQKTETQRLQNSNRISAEYNDDNVQPQKTQSIRCKRNMASCKDYIIQDYKTERIDESQMNQILNSGNHQPVTTNINLPQSYTKPLNPIVNQQNQPMVGTPVQVASSSKDRPTTKAPSIANAPAYMSGSEESTGMLDNNKNVEQPSQGYHATQGYTEQQPALQALPSTPNACIECSATPEVHQEPPQRSSQPPQPSTPVASAATSQAAPAISSIVTPAAPLHQVQSNPQAAATQNSALSPVVNTQQTAAVQSAYSHQQPANTNAAPQHQITATQDGGVRISPNGAPDPLRDITVKTEGDGKGNMLPDNRVVLHSWSVEDPATSHTRVIAQDVQPITSQPSHQSQAHLVADRTSETGNQETVSYYSKEDNLANTPSVPAETKVDYKEENSDYSNGVNDNTVAQVNNPNKPQVEEQSDGAVASKTSINDYEKQSDTNQMNNYETTKNQDTSNAKDSDLNQNYGCQNPQDSCYQSGSDVAGIGKFDKSALSSDNNVNAAGSATQKDSLSTEGQYIPLPDLDIPQSAVAGLQPSQQQINGVPIGTAQEEAPVTFSSNQIDQQASQYTSQPSQGDIQSALNTPLPASSTIIPEKIATNAQSPYQNTMKTADYPHKVENTNNPLKPNSFSKVAGPSKIHTSDIINGFTWPSGVNPGAPYSSEMLDLWRAKGIAPVKGYLKSKIQEKDKTKIKHVNPNYLYGIAAPPNKQTVMTVLNPKIPTGPSIAYEQTLPAASRVYANSKSTSKSKASPNLAQSSASNTNTAAGKNHGATTSTDASSRHHQPGSGYGYGSGNGYGYGQRSWGWGGGGGWAGQPPPQGMPTPGDFSGSPPNIPSFPSGGSPAPAAPPAAPAPSPGGANTQYVQQKPLPVRPKGSNKLKEKYVENKKKPVNENGEKIKEASQSKTTKITKQKDNYRYRNVKQNKFEQPRMSVRVRPGYYNVNIISRKHDII